MQEIKLIVSDIDNTLVHALSKEPTRENLEAVKRVQDRGIRFTLATGRALATTRRFIKLFGVKMPVITCNGAEIANQEETFYSERFPKRLVLRIMDMLSDMNVRHFLYSGRKVYCLKGDMDERLREAWKGGGMHSGDLVYLETREEIADAAAGNTQKILGWADSDEMHKELLSMQSQFAEVDVVNTLGMNAEFIRKDVNKGSALKWLCELYDIPSDCVLALGDAGNDVEMLQFAGVGVAVSNGQPEAAAAADHIVDNSNGTGVAEAIGRFVLNV
ncbi:MAG: HAD family hydrolase [Christensenellaceae bacterium]|jgi:Cof subfamily protein (haloacid dehalogenase superfamily)